jgi:hypothetical protein
MKEKHMGADVKADLHIPDLWFDFYARLLPGVAFVGAIRCFLLGNVALPSWTEIFVLLGLGYFVALLTQPIGSRSAGWIERLAELSHGVKEKLFIRRVQKALGPDSNQSMILFKMHGEVTFFVQLGWLSLVYWLVQQFADRPVMLLKCYPLLFAAVCGMLAFEVALRRLERAIKDGELVDVRPSDENVHLKASFTD